MFGTYSVVLEGEDTPREVTADNRDFIAFRRRGFRDLGYSSPDPLTAKLTEAGGNEAAQGLELLEFITWLVWNAGARSGAWASDFETFTEKECVSFTPVEVEGAGGIDTADPTEAAPPASSAS